MPFLSRIKRSEEIPRGLFTYRGKNKYAGMALQLRVEPQGLGLLVINASTVLHLNGTATAHAYFFIQGLSTEESVRHIKNIYRVDTETARKEHEKLIYTVSTLAQTEKVCPMSFLDVKSVEPFTREYTAPLRMDLALTFRCQNNCVHCYAGGPHETEELATAQWKSLIDRLHEIGVFIVTFTGGEPTLRKDLTELVVHAEKRGIVTGLVTNGRELKSKEYVDTLEKAGLDFVQITLESHKPEIHDHMTGTKGSWKETVQGIRNAVSSQIYVTTNSTLGKDNAQEFLQTVDFVKELGVAAFGVNSLIYAGKAHDVSDKFALPLEELKTLLLNVRDKANQLGLRFLWYTPTQYCQLDPVQLGLGVKSCTAAMVNMCVAPNGDVFPCQSYFEALGNLLRDSWDDMWHHPLAISIRKREYAQPKCKSCPQFQICGGGCPLELEEKEHICAEAQ